MKRPINSLLILLILIAVSHSAYAQTNMPTFMVELGDMEFIPSTNSTTPPSSDAPSRIISIGSVVRFTHALHDTNGILWAYGTAEPVQSRPGYEITDPPISGWMDIEKNRRLEDQYIKQNTLLLQRRASQKAFQEELIQQMRRQQYDQGVTYSAYTKIMEGMWLFQVDAIIGTPLPEEVSSSGNIKTYIWRDGFRVISATFRDGQLVSKSQSGLGSAQ